MQLRTSPGGSMLNSLRSRPLDPPSSVTVTTAQSSAIRADPSERCGYAALTTYFLSPLRRVERPVPPPIATTRNSRSLRARIGINRAPRLLLREEVRGLRLDRDKAIR